MAQLEDTMSAKLPESREPDVADALRSMIRTCGVAARSAVYVSTPITTGPVWFEWRVAANDPSTHKPNLGSHEDAVLRPNLERASTHVSILRKKYAPTPVIDPTALGRVDGWKQSDYHLFWVSVIEEFAATIVFLKGWQFSEGCAMEFDAGSRLNLPLRTEGLGELSVPEGTRLLRLAAKELAGARFPSRTIENVAARVARRVSY